MTFRGLDQQGLRVRPYRLPAMRYLPPPEPDDSGSVQLITIGETSPPDRDVLRGACRQ